MPAILEYIPYRKGDGTAPRDWPRHVYFAGHGYAVLRVDLRGSGESDGLLHDEYLPLEQEDALEVLRWIAAQPWSTGRRGHVRHLLGRLQRAPGGGARAAGAQGRDHALLDRRPLRRRRALPRRRGARARDALVGRVDAVLQRDRPRPRGGRAGLARRLARADRQRRAVRVRVASPPAPRRLLEAGLGVRGLRRDRVPGVRDRRLGRRLLRGRAAARGGAGRARRRGCSARGRTRSPTRSSRGPRSASSRSACAGGTSG